MSFRADFNVPIENSHILDDNRIRETIPTIRLILEKDASRLVIASHLGRPGGRAVGELSMGPIRKHLERLLGIPVGDEASQMGQYKIILLENLRFNPAEESKKTDSEPVQKFCSWLSTLADVYVNDAFGTMHRPHASIVGLKDLHPKVSGLLVQRELALLGPLMASGMDALVLGGAKVTDKMPLIMNLLSKIKHLIIGGAMAFTFIHHNGRKIGESCLDSEADIEAIYLEAAKHGVQIHLPQDFIISKSVKEPIEMDIIEGDIRDGFYGVDIGPKARDTFSRVIEGNLRVFWNGPMGIFEVGAFSEGTIAICASMARLYAKNGLAVVGKSNSNLLGGGDSTSAIHKSGFKVTHVSTGGGATLEFLQGKDLPGIAFLDDL